MPVSYPMPNIKPADPASHWLQGMQIGASIQNAKNQLDMQQERLAAEERQQEMANQRQKQQMELTAQMQQAQQGLKKAQLEQSGQKLQAVAQAAAQRFAAQQKYQQRVQQLSQAMPMDAASQQAALEIGPAMGMNSSAMGAIYRSMLDRRQASVPPTVKYAKDGAPYIVDSRGHVTVPHVGPTQTTTEEIPAQPEQEAVPAVPAILGGLLRKGTPGKPYVPARNKQIIKRTVPISAANAAAAQAPALPQYRYNRQTGEMELVKPASDEQSDESDTEPQEE